VGLQRGLLSSSTARWLKRGTVNGVISESSPESKEIGTRMDESNAAVFNPVGSSIAWRDIGRMDAVDNRQQSISGAQIP
jgi:hypothetical protein